MGSCVYWWLHPQPHQPHQKHQQHRHIHQAVGARHVGLEILDRQQETEVGGGEHHAGEAAREGEGDRGRVRVSAHHGRDDRKGGADETDGEAR